MNSIVIPVTDITPQCADLLDRLLFSIHTYEYYKDHHVIVCFDSVNPNFAEFFVNKYNFIEPIVNRGNRMNFCGNSNAGLRKAYEHGGNAVLVNQDVVLPSPKYFNQLSGEGLCSPQQVTVCKVPLTESCLEDLEAVQPNISIRQQHNKVVAFCLFINHKVMEEIGFLDEYFVASFDDDDYCVRARLKGFPVETVNIAVDHAVSKCGAYDNERLQLNFAKFKYKWSIPNDVAHLACAEWILNNHSWHELMRCS